jgi:hypothetical protein
MALQVHAGVRTADDPDWDRRPVAAHRFQSAVALNARVPRLNRPAFESYRAVFGHERGGPVPPKEVAMHAVFTRVEIDSRRADEARELLKNQTVPMVKQAPGFVSGTWMRSEDRTRGQGIMLFESEETAKAVAERAATGLPQGAPATFVSAEVFEVLAQA